ncbi:histidine kinase [Pedobacter kyungheensis]|uniref:Histidine kinase n=1 Tax=Pedobacter kyungheensis TaxID=1069985 RepID=A0A0C1F9T4_9SPHI|nr:two-component regulator propeller domain-containing protein [Pedobacter kyungheensis]KIA88633.1 histidine kinase [Pedobacter kyungheensis]
MKKRNVFYYLLIVLAGVIYFPAQAQQKNEAKGIAEKKGATAATQSPKGIVRTIKQDRKGNIWIASWQGIFKYDTRQPKEENKFTNITGTVSSARFFSLLEDRKGNFWFASVGSGVYYYDGKSFRHFTTKDGLANDVVTSIYEDRAGNIWLSTGSGVSRYNPRLPEGEGKAFQNFRMTEALPVKQTDSVHVSAFQQPIPEDSWMHNDVNAIIEDKAGKFWIATRGNARIYDASQADVQAKAFTTITRKDGKPFTNVRSIIKDKKGNIWLGGFDGLWRYDGHTFTNFSPQFVGYVYEDKKGNIWTSSESAKGKNWVLSRYEAKTLTDEKPKVTEVITQPMIFGIQEDNEGNIWYGAVDGVHRYNTHLPKR